MAKDFVIRVDSVTESTVGHLTIGKNDPQSTLSHLTYPEWWISAMFLNTDSPQCFSMTTRGLCSWGTWRSVSQSLGCLDVDLYIYIPLRRIPNCSDLGSVPSLWCISPLPFLYLIE